MIEKEQNDEMVRSSARDLTTESREEFYNEGLRLHKQALSGNRAAAKMALELWKKAYEKNPKDAVAQAYYGISMVLVGRDSSDFGQFIGDTIKGLIYLNRAIERDPDNPHIRVLLGYLAHSVPEAIFKKPDKPVKDESNKGVHGQEGNMVPQEYRRILQDVSMLYHVGKRVVSDLKGLKEMVQAKRMH